MILYIGNKLSSYGYTPTSVDVLGKLLAKDLDLISVSDKINKVARLMDMLYSIIKYRHNINFVLIDTYSTSNFYYTLLCAIFSKWLNIPYIPILHGGNLENRLKYSNKISKFIFTNSYINIAPSNYLKVIFERYNYKVVYIPNSLEVDKYCFIHRKKITPKLLYVRAFSFIYNPQMALDVLYKLKQVYTDAQLCMVGPDKDGSLDKIKQKAIELGLKNDIIFTGKLSKEEWMVLSKEYDIFINTTNVDNTPVSVMEAMALGLPVVSTNVGGIPYLIDDGIDGLLVERNNVQDMVEKISYLIENIDISQQIIKNARKKVEYFDWQYVQKEWINLLEGGNDVFI